MCNVKTHIIWFVICISVIADSGEKVSLVVQETVEKVVCKNGASNSEMMMISKQGETAHQKNICRKWGKPFSVVIKSVHNFSK